MIKNLSINEQKLRDLYLRKLALGEIQGPPTGYASQDKPWLKYYTASAIKSDMPKMTIFDYLCHRNKSNGEKTALNYFGRKITYQELIKNIYITADAFKSLGVKKGDIVTISMPSTPEVVYMFYALSLLGAVSNMVDPRTSEEGIEDYVKEVDSKLLVVIDVALKKVYNIKNNTNVENIVVVSPADSLPLALNLGYRAKEFMSQFTSKSNDNFKNDNCILWKNFFKMGLKHNKGVDNIAYIGCYPYPSYEENRPVVIVHTGGTTGKPKGVVLSNDSINCASYQCELAGFDFKSEHNWLNIMPPFIAYGIGNGLHLPLLCGMEVIMIPQFKPEEFDKLLNKYKPNHMVGVPSHYSHLIESKKLQNADLSYIIAPTVGGDKMDEKLEKETNKFLSNHGCPYKVTKGYGLTEVNAAVAACNSNESNEIGSVGIPFPKTVIAIFDPDTEEELRYDEIGEVCITGPNTMMKYFKNEDETQKMLRVHKDGLIWVHSGDLGKMTEDGKLFIHDRIKRMIIRSDGFKVFPNLIEDVILKHPMVETCKVVGVRDLAYSQGKLPKAHIVLKESSTVDENLILEELKNLCLKELPEYTQPVDYQIEKELPLTAIGKVDYVKLEELDNKNLKNVYTKTRLKTQ